MARGTEPLYIGVGGHVVAIDRATGAEIWKTKLKGTFVTLAVDKNAVYAGANGELYCLDPSTGAVRWHNKLKGLGMNVIAFGGSSQASVIMAAVAAQAAAAAAAAT